jgi:glutaconate CoA-transferase subunit A
LVTSPTIDLAAARDPWRDSVARLVAPIADGARIGVGGFHFTRLPIAQLLELRRLGRRELTYVAWGGGLALELLLDADGERESAVSRAELTFSSLDVFGLAPRFRRALEDGALELREWTALGLITALRARSQRLGFEVMPRLAGTDLGGDWSLPVEDPFGGDGIPQAAVPALALDALLLHAGRADEAGNVEIRGAQGIDRSAIFAADRVLVTVEERVRTGELGARGAFVVPRAFVSAVALAPDGAYPSSCLPQYPADLRRLARVAAVPAGVPLPDELLVPAPADIARGRAAGRVAPRTLLRALEREAPAAPPPPAPTRDEVMACALARTIRSGGVASVGSASPLPTAAYLLAKLLWAPDLTILSFNGGMVDVGWRPMTLSLAELLDFHSAAAHAGGDETYHWYYQQGRVSHEVVGTAQLDRSGATNNLAVTRADGATVRLPGQGGMADVANLHENFLLYLPRQSARNTVVRVARRSAARAWHHPELRRRYGLAPGETAVLTDLGRFELDPAREALVLTHLHPGVELDEVRERTGWELVVADELRVTLAPSDEELSALRERVDPLGVRRLDFVAAAERGPLIAELLDREEQVLERALHGVPAGGAAQVPAGLPE